MLKKIAILVSSALLLGGCTLTDSLKSGNAAKDQKSEVVATTTPSPTVSPDTSLESMPPVSNSTEVTSLEADINGSVILDEDFSDLN
jgi:PBP1b-binding outer membrane lipoprotein LpoB